MNQSLNQKIYSGELFNEIRDKALEKNAPVAISFLNPFSYHEVQKSEALIEGIDYYFSDGELLCKLHNLFLPKISRASFDYSSIAKPFLEYVADKNKALAVIGATTSENKKAVEVLKNQYPKINIVYNRDGYVNDIPTVVKQIAASNAEVVIIGMGTPYQEKFCIEAKKLLNHPVLLITCGGFLTQTSIKPDYYHPVIKKLGLRWLQRMVMHKHVRNRVLKQYPYFVCNYLFYMVFKKGK